MVPIYHCRTGFVNLFCRSLCNFFSFYRDCIAVAEQSDDNKVVTRVGLCVKEI